MIKIGNLESKIEDFETTKDNLGKNEAKYKEISTYGHHEYIHICIHT